MITFAASLEIIGEALPVLPVPQPPPPPGETQPVPSGNGGAPYLQPNILKIPTVRSLCRCVHVCIAYVYFVCVLKANLMRIWLQIG